jgi:tRNA (cmo5U34)-methyltransferase
MGYSDMEIANKREALENVLIPFQRTENIKLLSDSGFQNVTTFFQWFNFSGFLAIK